LETFFQGRELSSILVRSLPYEEAERYERKGKAFGELNQRAAGESKGKEKTMRYMIISNLGIILSILAVLGKSAWGKSIWNS
jgi:hypothetical protein